MYCVLVIEWVRRLVYWVGGYVLFMVDWEKLLLLNFLKVEFYGLCFFLMLVWIFFKLLCVCYRFGWMKLFGFCFMLGLFWGIIGMGLFRIGRLLRFFVVCISCLKMVRDIIISIYGLLKRFLGVCVVCLECILISECRIWLVWNVDLWKVVLVDYWFLFCLIINK